MAEILIKFGDQGLLVGGFKSGDPVTVQGDGFEWGRVESRAVWVAQGNDPAFWPGNTVMLKIPGTPAAQVIQFAQSHADGLRQRANNFDFTGLGLSPGDVVTATRAQALARLKIKT